MRKAVSWLLVAALWSCANAAHAITIVVGNAPPMLLLLVGSAGAAIPVVTFDLTHSRVGDGTPVTGSPARVRILAIALATPANSRTAILTADSASRPLRSGSHEIPFTHVYWTSSSPDIPSGRFNGTTDQTLASFLNSRIVSAAHTFVYDNDIVPPAGVYTGQVTYTLSMP